MLKKISTFVDYVTWLYKQNALLQKTSSAIFRIIKNDRNHRGEHLLDIQIINKSTVFQCLAKEIAANDQLLDCFSKTDVRVITYLATEDLFKPKNRIISHGFNESIQRTELQIRSVAENTCTNLTSDKILLNKNILKSLSQEDAHRAGYLLAIEEMELEKRTLEKFNKR